MFSSIMRPRPARPTSDGMIKRPTRVKRPVVKKDHGAVEHELTGIAEDVALATLKASLAAAAAKNIVHPMSVEESKAMAAEEAQNQINMIKATRKNLKVTTAYKQNIVLVPEMDNALSADIEMSDGFNTTATHPSEEIHSADIAMHDAAGLASTSDVSVTGDSNANSTHPANILTTLTATIAGVHPDYVASFDTTKSLTINTIKPSTKPTALYTIKPATNQTIDSNAPLSTEAVLPEAAVGIYRRPSPKPITAEPTKHLLSPTSVGYHPRPLASTTSIANNKALLTDTSVSIYSYPFSVVTSTRDTTAPTTKHCHSFQASAGYHSPSDRENARHFFMKDEQGRPFPELNIGVKYWVDALDHEQWSVFMSAVNLNTDMGIMTEKASIMDNNSFAMLQHDIFIKNSKLMDACNILHGNAKRLEGSLILPGEIRPSLITIANTIITRALFKTKPYVHEVQERVNTGMVAVLAVAKEKLLKEEQDAQIAKAEAALIAAETEQVGKNSSAFETPEIAYSDEGWKLIYTDNGWEPADDDEDEKHFASYEPEELTIAEVNAQEQKNIEEWEFFSSKAVVIHDITPPNLSVVEHVECRETTEPIAAKAVAQSNVLLSDNTVEIKLTGAGDEGWLEPSETVLMKAYEQDDIEPFGAPEIGLASSDLCTSAQDPSTHDADSNTSNSKNYNLEPGFLVTKKRKLRAIGPSKFSHLPKRSNIDAVQLLDYAMKHHIFRKRSQDMDDDVTPPLKKLKAPTPTARTILKPVGAYRIRKSLELKDRVVNQYTIFPSIEELAASIIVPEAAQASSLGIPNMASSGGLIRHISKKALWRRILKDHGEQVQVRKVEAVLKKELAKVKVMFLGKLGGLKGRHGVRTRTRVGVV